MTNIVELNYSSKKNRLVETSDSLYVYYPVKVIPVKYWSVEKNEISIISQTILQLGKIKGFSLIEIMEKMKIPKEWSGIIEYEVNDLISKGLLAKESELIYKTVAEGEPTKSTYKEGYMFFDEVRGQFFEYVHEQDLLFSFEEKVDFVLEGNTKCTKNYFDSAKCDEQMKLAVFNFNEMKVKYFNEGELSEESVVETAVTDEIRVEKKPFAFAKEAYLPIKLTTSQIFYRQDGESYTNIVVTSPFTREPSVLLQSIIENQAMGKMAVEWLNDSLNDELEQQMLGRQTVTSLLECIENGLKGTRVSESVFEYLQVGEKVLMEYEEGVIHPLASRSMYINNYNLALEAVMQELIADKLNLEVPEQWRKEYKAKTLDRLIETSFYDMQRYISKGIMNNMKKLASKIVKYNGLRNVNIYGNRDFMAVLLLHDLLDDQRWRRKIMAKPTILADYETFVSERNEKGGHHNEKMFQMKTKDYYEQLMEYREKAYILIQFLEEK